MSTPQELKLHVDALRSLQERGISQSSPNFATEYWNARREITGARLDTSTMTPHLAALARLEADGVTQHSPNLATKYDETYAAITLERQGVAPRPTAPAAAAIATRSRSAQRAVAQTVASDLETALSGAVAIAEGRITGNARGHVFAALSQLRVLNGAVLPLRATMAVQSAAVARNVVLTRSLASQIRSMVAASSQPKDAA